MKLIIYDTLISISDGKRRTQFKFPSTWIEFPSIEFVFDEDYFVSPDKSLLKKYIDIPEIDNFSYVLHMFPELFL